MGGDLRLGDLPVVSWGTRVPGEIGPLEKKEKEKKGKTGEKEKGEG